MGLFSRRNKTIAESGSDKFAATLGSPFKRDIQPEPGVRAYSDVPLWFERFGDIPGLEVDIPSFGNRSSLLGHDERPWVLTSGGSPSDQKYQDLQWPGTKGFGEWTPTTYGHNWSPAQRLFFGFEPVGGRTSTQIVDNLWPTLEVPGTGLDYHFLIQGAVEQLWKIRETDVDARASIIRVATLDRELVKALPESIFVGLGKDQPSARDQCLERLAAVYEQLGDLESAFDVTTFALQFGQMEPRHRRLAKKLGKEIGQSN